MSRTFTKLFSSITESTVWCEPDRTRLVWIAMLAMADHAGRVWGSVPGLANRARVPTADCRLALVAFMSPDPDSRTKDYEGRRIEAIDGGWRLLNHAKYRALKDEESVKESKRRYINGRRAKEREAASVENVEQSRSASAHAYTEAEADTSKARSKASTPSAKRGCRLSPDWLPSEADIAFAEERRVNWRREADSFRDYWAAKPGADACKLDWPATWRNWIRRAVPAPRGPEKSAASKTMQAIQRLEGMKNGNGLALEGSDDWVPEAAVLALGRTTG